MSRSGAWAGLAAAIEGRFHGRRWKGVAPLTMLVAAMCIAMLLVCGTHRNRLSCVSQGIEDRTAGRDPAVRNLVRVYQGGSIYVGLSN